MKYNKEVFLKTLILLFIFSYLFAAPNAVKSHEVGVILVAHGSTNSTWNNQVLSFYQNNIESDSEILPSKLAFLYFNDMSVDMRSLEVVTPEMLTENSDMKRILFVHLSPSSYSVRHEEIQTRVDNLLTDTDIEEYKIVAMDAHPKAVEILKDHANEFYVNDPTRSPANESLMLVAYGAINELENNSWLNQLEAIGKLIDGELGFNNVEWMTLRYHSADRIRAKAVKKFRKAAKRLAKKGKVIVIPYVLCQGKFQEDLQFYIEGLKPVAAIENVDICPKGVISHNNMKVWVKQVFNNFKEGKALPQVNPVNRTWSAMDAEKGGNKKHEYGHVKENVITPTPK